MLTVDDLAATDGFLHPVPPAFSDGLGPQSGFCASEQIMSAVGLNRANPRPSREEARQAMSDNLCRCGACDHIGKNFVLPDVVGKVTGKAMFAEDFRADGMVFAHVYANLSASPSTSGATATSRRDSTTPRLCSRSRS